MSARLPVMFGGPGIRAGIATRLQANASGSRPNPDGRTMFGRLPGYTAKHRSDGFGAGHEHGETGMNPEAWTILAVGVALGSLVWRMLRSLRYDVERQFGVVGENFGEIGKLFADINQKFDGVNQKFDDVNRKFDEVYRKFDDVEANFRDMRNRLDRLADDHHGLSRELSELRGELRGRFDEQARPAPG